ncbi:MAG: TolB family protein [Candidatus Sumerlaeota bacterium]
MTKTNFQNPKWSPDGSAFFVVFGTEVYRNSTKSWDYPSIKSLVYGKANGSDLRYLDKFGHHSMWHPDGSGILVHNRRENRAQGLVLYDLDGNEPEMFFPDLPGVHCSPDRAAKRLVTDIFDYANQSAQVALFDIESRQKTLLAEGSHYIFDHVTGCHPHPQWSRDEKSISFNMGDTGIPQVYFIRNATIRDQTCGRSCLGGGGRRRGCPGRVG